MENSFEVEEWESTSKEQDLLVDKLFGDISFPRGTKEQGIRTHSIDEKYFEDSSKGEKKKADESNVREKRKRKEKNKTAKLTDEQSCTEPKRKQSRNTNGGFSTDTLNVAEIADEKPRKPTEQMVTVEANNVEHEVKSKKRKKKKNRKKSGEGEGKDDSKLLNSKESSRETERKNKGEKTRTDRKEANTYEETTIENNSSPQGKQPTKLHKDVDASNHSSPTTKSSLQEKMTKRLESSRFRWINEQLYTTTGNEALTMFSEDPDLFDIYHRGFTNQVKLWPVNPVNSIIKWLKKRPSLVVVDFGCGEAVIAQNVTNKVHSFDLVAKNEFVTACDMAMVPLQSASVDVAVFCLSLMGTNLVDYLKEAHRVLKPGGILKVAEVTSRINNTTEFSKSLSKLGFKLEVEDSTNKMFVLFDFIKVKESVKQVSGNKLEGLNLKPCIYKKR